MLQNTVTEYIQELAASMLATEVTDRSGAVISLDQGAERAIEMLLGVKSASGKVMLAGNGGSAAIVSHIQNDLCKAVGVRGLVFSEQPLLMALANDEGYGRVFEQPIELWAEPGDLVITVSSSGNSENIIRALQAANAKGCSVITFSGFNTNNSSRPLGDLNFYVPSHSYGHVETTHSAIAHFITDKARSLSLTPSKAEAGT